MEKIKLYSIGHDEEGICYQIEKHENYYEFLFQLLELLGIPIPDIRNEETGKLPDIMKEEDSHMHYGKKDSKVTEFIGHKRIFLIIKTDKKEELFKFIEDNCELYKPK